MSESPQTIEPTDPRLNQPLFHACLNLLQRAGAKNTTIGWVEETVPHTWYAFAGFPPAGPGGSARAEAAAALDPVTAAVRLTEQLVDGGRCVHCGRETTLSITPNPVLERLAEFICFYRFDRERSTFRRDCEDVR